MQMNQRTIIFALAALAIILGGYMSLRPKAVEVQPSQDLSLIDEENQAMALASIEPDGEAAIELANLEPAAGEETPSATVALRLPEERKAHILENHKDGTGVACKSEFPASWTDEQIIANVQKLAANDNLEWKQEDNGYYVAEAPVDDLTLRVVVNRAENSIVTGYPVSVVRNPCPAREPANDNVPAQEPAAGEATTVP